MPKTTIAQLADYGQSIWLDHISKSLFSSGKLKRMIDSGLRGMTSNPSIFNESIGNSSDYDEAIAPLKEQGKNSFEIYDQLTMEDIGHAAQAFSGVYQSTQYLDGYVSLEINPKLAMQAKESIEEGIRLFRTVNRSNVMIKVPATNAGYEIAEELLARGVNVNVTLIFSLEQYKRVAEAFMKGMARLSKTNADLSKVRSVASVFVSRLDTAVDHLLDQKCALEKNKSSQENLRTLKGKAAVANCQLIFHEFNKIFYGPAFKMLSKEGCPVQRVLWASTGTKNLQYSDIKYMAELISKPTVNTLPEKTILAFTDHGIVKEALTGLKEEAAKAEWVFDQLLSVDIRIDAICQKLLADGLVAFEKSFDILLNSIETKSESLAGKS